MNIVTLTFDLILVSIAGLFIAFSPMLIITDLLIVLKSKRPILHAIVLLTSIALPLFLLAVVASLVIKPDQTIEFSILVDKVAVPPLINAIIGFILGYYSITQFIKLRYRPLQPATIKSPGKKPPTKVLPLFAFGFMKTLFSLTNIFAILFVTKLITSHKLGPLLALFIVFWTIAIGLVPFFIIFYYQKNKREYLLKLQATLDTRMSKNVKAYAFIGLAIIGGTLFVNGIWQIITKA